MQPLRETSIFQIKPVSGLFISDRFAARSISLLKSCNIGYILSITRPEDVPKFSSQNQTESDATTFKDQLVMKHINIDDDPTENILCHLKDTCDWIETSLGSKPTKDGEDHIGNGGVLVHCTQGISRSGSIIIAYLMRKFSLNYPAALALARESRPLVTPNPGFEYQLRVWHFCGYDIYLSDESTTSNSSSLEEKEAYKAWKSNRDAMLGRGEETINKARFASMASVAASFGRRRVQESEETRDRKDVQGEEKSEEEKRKAWENVEKMEQEWTRRLITGTYPPWEEKKKSEKDGTGN